MKLDPRIDAYIAKSADFAHPILKHLRKVVHDACPSVEETIKWGMPHFDYKGSMMCSMAAFKQHCSFGFWRGARIVASKHNKDTEAMGQFGRVTALDDLPPPTVISRYVKAAMKLTDSGVKAPESAKRTRRKPLPVPPELAAALKRNKKALATFDSFSPSKRRDYIDWIAEAKRDETGKQRLAKAIEWMAQGKPRHWKYVRKNDSH